MKKQSVVRGAVSLTMAVGFVKVLGALFKLPLANLLGGEGMGLFSTAYSLFGPLYAVTVGGFPTALCTLVSRFQGQGRIREIRAAVRAGWLFFGSVGLLGSAVMWVLAEPFCEAVGNPGAVLCVRMTAPALLGCSAMSVERGYFQGLGNMDPTAFSQVAEAAVKVASGLGGAVFARYWCVTRLSCTGAETLPYMAAGATAGVTISTFAGLCCLLVCRRTAGRRLTVPLLHGQSAVSFREVLSELVRLTLPVCIGSAAVSLTTLVDLCTVMNCLSQAAASAPELSVRLGLPSESVPIFLYGSYQGMTVSLYLLIPALTSSFGVSALPAVSRAVSAGRLEEARRCARSVLRVVTLIAVPAGVGLSVLPDELLSLLYPSRSAEIAVVTDSLRVLGLAGICLGVSTPVHALLQAAGKPGQPVLLLIGGALIKLCVNLMLIPRPELNLLGAAYGSICCNVFLMLGGLLCLCRTLRLHLSPRGTVKLLLPGAACALTAALLRRTVSVPFASVVISAFGGGTVYFLLLFALRVPELTRLFLFVSRNNCQKHSISKNEAR